MKLLPLVATFLLFAVTANAAGPRVLHRDDRWILLGGKSPTFIEINVAADAGETITISIAEGADDAGDGGCSWHLDSLQRKVIAKGFTKETKMVSWNVKLPVSNPVLVIEDRDTNTGRGKTKGNGIKLRITASGIAPSATPAKGKYDNYFGGPKAWYDSGNQLGKADRKAGKKGDPTRYKDHYDNITEGEFRRGYKDGFK